MDAFVIDPLRHQASVAPPQRTSGRLEVAFHRRGPTTAVARLYQEGAAKARLPREPERGLIDVTLINLGGGLTGGDRLHQRLVWERASAAGATTQAAEKIYRARDGRAEVRTELVLGAGAWAEWLPQETILFDGAALDRSLLIDAAADARLLAVEPVVFGRLAMGERVQTSHVHDRIEVRVEGVLAWLDVNRLVPPVEAKLDRPALGGGARAIATVVYVGPDAGDRLDALRAIVAAAPVPAGVTRLDHVLVVRLHAASPLALRRALLALLPAARAALGGLPPRLPRLWHG